MMAPSMKVGGRITGPMVKEELFMPTEIFTKVSGRKIKRMGSVFTRN